MPGRERRIPLHQTEVPFFQRFWENLNPVEDLTSAARGAGRTLVGMGKMFVDPVGTAQQGAYDLAGRMALSTNPMKDLGYEAMNLSPVPLSPFVKAYRGELSPEEGAETVGSFAAMAPLMAAGSMASKGMNRHGLYTGEMPAARNVSAPKPKQLGAGQKALPEGRMSSVAAESVPAPRPRTGDVLEAEVLDSGPDFTYPPRPHVPPKWQGPPAGEHTPFWDRSQFSQQFPDSDSWAGGTKPDFFADDTSRSGRQIGNFQAPVGGRELKVIDPNRIGAGRNAKLMEQAGVTEFQRPDITTEFLTPVLDSYDAEWQLKQMGPDVGAHDMVKELAARGFPPGAGRNLVQNWRFGQGLSDSLTPRGSSQVLDPLNATSPDIDSFANMPNGPRIAPGAQAALRQMNMQGSNIPNIMNTDDGNRIVGPMISAGAPAHHILQELVRNGFNESDARSIINNNLIGHSLTPTLAGQPTPPSPPTPPQFGQAPAVHIPNSDPLATSTRVEQARRALEAEGIDTQMARQVVPRRGTDAENFQRGLSSVMGPAAPPPTDVLPIRDLIGPYQNLGRTRKIQKGASPKTLLKSQGGGALRSAMGDEFVYKGYPVFGGGRNSSFADIAASVAGKDEKIDKEWGISAVSNLMNKKTPVARRVAEGGSLQSVIPGDLKTFSDLGLGHLADPSRVAQVTKQLQTEQIADAMNRVTDRHYEQYMMDKTGASDIVWPVDKGLGVIERIGSPAVTPDQMAEMEAHYAEVYGGLQPGGAYFNHLDPNHAADYIRHLQQIPEADFKSALDPLLRSRSDADKATFMRKYMQDIMRLRDYMNQYYRRKGMPELP